MKVAYTQEELVSSTELAKAFGGFVDKIVSHAVEKIAIVRHNKPEAVILPIDEYERMKALADLAEELEIASVIAERDANGAKEGMVSLEAYHAARKARRDKKGA